MLQSGFIAGFPRQTVNVLACSPEIALNFAVVAGKVESQHALFSREHPPGFQIHPALENVRCEFANAQPRVEMRWATTRLQIATSVSLIDWTARLEAGRGCRAPCPGI